MAGKQHSITIGEKTFKSIEEYVLHGRGCATPHPSHYQIHRNDARLRASAAAKKAVKKIEINVQFIHILDGKNGKISETQRKKQINALNKAYAIAGVTFKYKPATVKQIDNAQWFGMDINSPEERSAKTALQTTPERNLNFYTAGLPGGLLGWAKFPWELAGDRVLDGVVILHSSLPGGAAAPYNLGMTAVHEIGHWLGLYHTFQGGCNAVGDHVGDTIAHAGPNGGKPADGQHLNACKPNELAPNHNYMNYCDDAWLTEFTSGQLKRIKKHVAEYRPGFVV